MQREIGRQVMEEIKFNETNTWDRATQTTKETLQLASAGILLELANQSH